MTMMLRVPSFPAMLAASVALAVMPAVAQSHGSSFTDTTTQSSPYAGTVVEDIIARVNDQVISKSDYERAMQELDGEARQQSWSQQQLMEQRRDLLRSLIDRQLLLSKGKELGISGETETIKRLDEIRKQNHLDSMEDLQKAAESQGVSFEDFKEQIRESAITSQVISQEVGQHIQVAPSEIQSYYNSHKQEFEHPEQVRLSEILIATPDSDNAAQVADAQKKADDIEARLKTGADFATVAKADSAGPTAAQGGDLGDFKHGQLGSKVLEDATFGLQAGQMTQPIRTKQGWVILKVTNHQNAGLAPLDEVQNQIQEAVGMQKMEPALRDYLAKLRDDAFIDIKSGYVDTGATPNEQKILQGAYVPPQARKKKHIERTRFRQKPVRKQKETEEAASPAPPAGVPTLDKVNSQTSKPKQVASNSGTEKPGKKEKIRFGQAPRETLPTAETRSVDAGAGEQSSNPQVAANSTGMALTNAQGDVIDTSGDTEKKTKTRFSDRLKESKQKRQEEKAANKHQKFVPPTETTDEQANDKLQSSALGLNGDTTKKQKTANPAKSGPKRRFSDEDKNKQQAPQTPTPPTDTGAPSPGTTTPVPGQTTPATQGTTSGTTQPQV